MAWTLRYVYFIAEILKHTTNLAFIGPIPQISHTKSHPHIHINTRTEPHALCAVQICTLTVTYDPPYSFFQPKHEK